LDVRPARVDDAAAIAAVHVRTWQAAYEHAFGKERLAAIDLGAREEIWRQRLAEPEARHTVLAEDGGSVVGFASFGDGRDVVGEGELYAIYVLPEAWGSGAGPALLAAAVGAMHASGFTSAILRVLDDNPRARRFYEREGWRQDGETREEEFLGVAITEVGYRITLG
jgi:ribosomal protein S18 acetylase RimI-like enzyme